MRQYGVAAAVPFQGGSFHDLIVPTHCGSTADRKLAGLLPSSRHRNRDYASHAARMVQRAWARFLVPGPVFGRSGAAFSELRCGPGGTASQLLRSPFYGRRGAAWPCIQTYPILRPRMGFSVGSPSDIYLIEQKEDFHHSANTASVDAQNTRVSETISPTSAGVLDAAGSPCAILFRVSTR